MKLEIEIVEYRETPLNSQNHF